MKQRRKFKGQLDNTLSPDNVHYSDVCIALYNGSGSLFRLLYSVGCVCLCVCVPDDNFPNK